MTYSKTINNNLIFSVCASWVILVINLGHDSMQFVTNLFIPPFLPQRWDNWLNLHKTSVHGTSKRVGCAFDKASFAARSACPMIYEESQLEGGVKFHNGSDLVLEMNYWTFLRSLWISHRELFIVAKIFVCFKLTFCFSFCTLIDIFPVIIRIISQSFLDGVFTLTGES